MSRVFVVQRQHKYDPATTNLVPKYDLSSAAQYGELVYLLSPTAGPFNTASIVTELREKLRDYTSEDYLLLIGNPCLIGWTVALAAHCNGGAVNLLQWSGKEQRYLPIVAQLWLGSVNNALLSANNKL